MTAGVVLDVGLVSLVLGVAAWVVAARENSAAVVGFVMYGLLLGILWVRLDVALTEAAIGGGATGVLLLGAASRLREPAPAPMPVGGRVAVGALCVAVTAVLSALVLMPPDPAPTLAAPSLAGLPALGVANPVTAVLVAYRAIDTLLEKVVLLLAVVAVWSLTPDDRWGARPAPWEGARPDPAISLLARLFAPVGVVVGVHIVWAGNEGPGGAFQGGTILAAMWLLAIMAGLLPAPAATDRRLRRVLVAGPAVFLAVGLVGSALWGGFLTYPAGWAKAVITLVEAALTVSVAAMVMALVVGPAGRAR